MRETLLTWLKMVYFIIVTIDRLSRPRLSRPTCAQGLNLGQRHEKILSPTKSVAQSEAPLPTFIHYLGSSCHSTMLSPRKLRVVSLVLRYTLYAPGCKMRSPL